MVFCDLERWVLEIGGMAIGMAVRVAVRVAVSMAVRMCPVHNVMMAIGTISS